MTDPVIDAEPQAAADAPAMLARADKPFILTEADGHPVPFASPAALARRLNALAAGRPLTFDRAVASLGGHNFRIVTVWTRPETGRAFIALAGGPGADTPEDLRAALARVDR